MKSYVVGRTDEREVYVASLDRAFIMNEYLLIKDGEGHVPVGEIVETYCLPMLTQHSFPAELGIKDSLDVLFDYEKRENRQVYIGKLKMLSEHQTPIPSHTELKTPEFVDVKKHLVQVSNKEGFTLGVIQGTSNLMGKLSEDLQDIAPLIGEGNQIKQQNGVPFILNFKSFKEYPHVGFFGGTGSGKSFGMRTLLEEMMKHRLPGLVFDPHNELEFSKVMTGLDAKYQESYERKYEVFKIGENVGINFTELNSSEIISLLEFVADLSQPMRGAIETLHERLDSFSTLLNRVNMLKKAFENMEKPERERDEISEQEALLYVKYRDKISGASTLQGVSWRLAQLDDTGLFSHGIDLVESALLNRKLAVIRGSQRHLKMIASYLISKLYYKRRNYKDWQKTDEGKRAKGKEPGKFPPFFVVIDEAHSFAPNNGTSNPTKRILKEIAQEARKYGVIEVFGTQRPSLLDTTITAQLNTKFIFRTGIQEDMEMIQKETNLTSDQVKRLPELTSGNAFVSSATLSKTMYIRFRTTKTESPHDKNPFDELDDFNNNDKLKEVVKECLPLTDSSIQKVHSQINQKMGKLITIKEIQEILEEMAGFGEIVKEKSPFGNRFSLV